ncbi:dTMP kinase [Occallatibacter savannae]|uniref:dTMP kinase n=1 Tax=Occallatibacter savannae TaxID=1002691 RepID=UPI000D69AB0F|nr:thymidylate kinase [Occallatibacter savannae]
MQNSLKVRTVSFSGVDGAGKTTQIDNLCAFLRENGIRYRVFRFWDDIARLTNVREGTGHRVFKGEKGIGSPERPINRRDKNVRGFPMTCIRMFLYLADALSTRKVFHRAMRGDVEFVIFDRYTYDELANMNLPNPVVRAYVRFIMALVPRPDISFLLDADPDAARARKPEYPVDFIRINRQAYFDLNRLVGGLTVVEPMAIDEAKRQVVGRVAALLNATPVSGASQNLKFTSQSGTDPVIS